MHSPSEDGLAVQPPLPESVLLDLLHRIAVLASEAPNLPSAAQRCMDAICEATGWPVGHLYLVSESGSLSSAGVWHLEDAARFERFRDVTTRIPLAPGEGIAGLVAPGRSAWLSDLSILPRFRAGEQFTLRTALACAIHVGSRLVGVFELFTEQSAAYDERLVHLLDTVGRLLGGVAERTETLADLRLGRERLRRILDTAGDAFVAMDAGGHVLDWNRQAERLSGWRADEVIGRSLAELIIPERHRAAHTQGLAQFLDTGAQAIFMQRVELTALHRDGREIPVELVVWPLRVGANWQFNAFLHDITERQTAAGLLRQQSDELAAANAELQRAHAVKDDFLAVTSHELRTPLTSILGYTHLLENRWDRLDDGERRDAVGIIGHEGVRLLSLVEDLLTMARIDAGAMDLTLRDVALGAAAHDALAGMIGLGLELHIDCPDNLVVHADLRALQQILLNYVTNAVKYGEAPITVSARSVGTWVEIRVRDTGTGVPAEFVSTMFEKFTQASPGSTRQSTGTGLGLAIVAQLAAGQGGEVWYEDAAPGACFGLRLPAGQA